MKKWILIAALVLANVMLQAHTDEDRAFIAELKRNALAGDSTSQYNLGVYYLNGDKVNQDLIQAKKWFEVATDSGDPDAPTRLGEMYYIGLGVLKDNSKAIEFFKVGARRGSKASEYNLGWMYFRGEGGSVNYERALEYFQDSARQGVSYAQYNLGLMYIQGIGTKKDLRKAKYWINQAYQSEDSDVSSKSKEIWVRYNLSKIN